eukprot:1151204-Alexandrium_andersonii.AAC.1
MSPVAIPPRARPEGRPAAGFARAAALRGRIACGTMRQRLQHGRERVREGRPGRARAAAHRAR